MTAIYRDDDADLRVLDGRRLAIIGYGNQGRAQALNLRDSGIRDVVVGTNKPPGDHPARGDGFKVLSTAEAVRQSDIVFLLVPDEVMPGVYREQIEPQLKAGMTLDFASGYNITFRCILPPPTVDVVMLAPRMIGDGVRELFRRQQEYPAFVAVHQDATGRARPTVLAMASAGVVLLVTGAGGAFGAVIKATGIGDLLARGIAGTSHSAQAAVLVTYAIAMVFRVSQGSGTVASITTMTIIAGARLPEWVGLHPVWLALAALSGGISVGHVNDSGFWVTTKLSGLTLTGGLKLYTLGEFIVSGLVLFITIVGSLLTPRFCGGATANAGAGRAKTTRVPTHQNRYRR